MGRVLGIDYGTKRIGTALSDEHKRSAFPHGIIPAATEAAAIQQLYTLIQTESVDEIVVGLPLDQDGQLGVMARRVQQFAEQLGRTCQRTVAFQDERLTSRISQQRMAAHTTVRQSRGELDAVAAQEILQTYLERTYGSSQQ